MPSDCVILVQQRAHKAGAQVALWRTFGEPVLQALHPVLLCGEEGWLTRAWRQRGLPCRVLPFPASRTLAARLLANGSFARRAARQLAGAGLRGRLVLGNDHGEGLLAHAVGRVLHIPRVLFLRSSETTRRDFHKHLGHRFDRVYAVGEELRARVAAWCPAQRVGLLLDGLGQADFHSPKPRAAEFPRHLLVVGSESPYKGWQDFAAALDRLEAEPGFPALTLDFTGPAPDPRATDVQLGKPRRSTLNFIGRVEQFVELVRAYDLVIHPSREESFGLAMLEVLAAGVPLVCSRVGVIGRIQENPALLFEPNAPARQAETLLHLWRHWRHIDFGIERCQEHIQRLCSLESIAATLARDFGQLLGAAQQ
jgi:glycosyltransferase involved in cell wall biosynthesis